MPSNRRTRPKARAWTRALAAVCGLAVLATLAPGCAQLTGRPDVVIGTAGPADVDYPLGGAICRLFNLGTAQHGLRCAEESSEGPLANLESLRQGRIDVGILPSDLLAEAVAGEGRFAARAPATDLRVLFAGHADVFTLVAHRESGIRTVADLRGRRVGIGSPGSRQRAGMDRVMAAFGLGPGDFAAVQESAPAAQNRAFCAGRLDAIVYSVGHPNGLVRHATLACGGALVAVGGPPVDRMLATYPDEYELVTIPGGTYAADPDDVRSFGVRAVVVTTRRTPEPVAYAIARAVFGNFDDFRRLHPAFERLTVAEAVSARGRAPVASGAARYYRERGWSP